MNINVKIKKINKCFSFKRRKKKTTVILLILSLLIIILLAGIIALGIFCKYFIFYINIYFVFNNIIVIVLLFVLLQL